MQDREVSQQMNRTLLKLNYYYLMLHDKLEILIVVLFCNHVNCKIFYT